MRHLAWVLGLGVILSASIACGPVVDLSRLEVVDTFSGYYDDGMKAGLNRLLPSVTFRLKNNGAARANQVQLTVAFWRDGEDGEWGGREVVGIGSTPVAPGAQTEPILVRGDVAYTLEQPRADLFTHSMFRDVTARILAKRDGRIVRIGEVKIDRRVIPRLSATAGQ